MGQRKEISGSSATQILINISPDKNTIASYVHDTEGNLLSVNDSWYRTTYSPFVWSLKLSLWEIPIWELMPRLHSSVMKSYTKGISNTINHKPPPWNQFLGAEGLHCLPKLLSSTESIQQALKLTGWFFSSSLLWSSTLNSFPLCCTTDEVTRITVNTELRKTAFHGPLCFLLVNSAHVGDSDYWIISRLCRHRLIESL